MDIKRSALLGHSSGAAAAFTAAALSRNLSLAPSLISPAARASGVVGAGRINPSFVNVPFSSLSRPSSSAAAAGAAAAFYNPDLQTSDPSWPVIQAVFALSMAFVAMPSAAPPAVFAPVFLLLGRRDTVVPVAQQAGIFDALSPESARRVFAVMENGNHCFLAPRSRYERPASDCDYSLARQRYVLSPSVQSWVARRYAVAFFRAALYGDAAAAQLAWGPLLERDGMMDVRGHEEFYPELSLQLL